METSISARSELHLGSHEQLNADENRSSLEREIKKLNGIIAKSKDQRAVQQLHDENGRLKVELEMLSDQKIQNQALKENIHHLVSSADQQRRTLEERLAIALKELTDLRQSSGGKAPEDVKPPPPYSTVEPVVELTATLTIVRAEAQALQTTVKLLRADKDKLSESFADVSKELAQLKAARPDAEKKAESAAAGQGGAAAAAATARSWWNRGNASAQAQPAANLTPGTASLSVSTNSVIAPDVHASKTPDVEHPPAQQGQTAAGGNTSKWWPRGAAAAAGGATAAAPAADQIKEIEALRKEREALQEQLKGMSGELDRLRSSQPPVAALEYEHTQEIAALKAERDALNEKLQNTHAELERLRTSQPSEHSTVDVENQLKASQDEVIKLRETITQLTSQTAPIAAIAEESKLQTQALEEAKARQEQMAAECQALQEKTRASLQEVDALKQQLQEAAVITEQERVRWADELAKLEAQAASLKENQRENAAASEIEEQKRKVEEENCQLAVQLEALTQETNSLRTRLETASSQFDQEKAAWTEREEAVVNEKQHVSDEAAALRTRLEDLTNDLAKERANWTQREEAAAKEKQEAAEHYDQVASMQKQLEDAIETSRSAQLTLEASKAEKETLQGEINALKELADRTNQECLVLRAAAAQSGSSQSESAQELVSLRDVLEARDKELAESKQTAANLLEQSESRYSAAEKEWEEKITEAVKVVRLDLAKCQEELSQAHSQIDTLKAEKSHRHPEQHRPEDSPEFLSMKVNHQIEISRLVEEHQQASKLAEQNVADRLAESQQALKADFDQKLMQQVAAVETRLREHHNEELKNVSSSNTDQDTVHKEEIARLSADFERKLTEQVAVVESRLREEHAEALRREVDSKSGELTAQKDNAHKEEISKLNADFEHKLTEQVAAVETRLREEHTEALRQEIDRNAGELAAQKDNTHKEEIARLNANFERELTEQVAAVEARLKEEHAEALRIEVDNKAGELTAQKDDAHKEEIAKLNAHFEGKLIEQVAAVEARLKEVHAEAVRKEVENKAGELTAQKDDAHREEIANLNAHFEGKLIEQVAAVEARLKEEHAEALRQAVSSKEKELKSSLEKSVSEINHNWEQKLAERLAEAEKAVRASAEEDKQKALAAAKEEKSREEKAHRDAIASKDTQIATLTSKAAEEHAKHASSEAALKERIKQLETTAATAEQRSSAGVDEKLAKYKAELDEKLKRDKAEVEEKVKKEQKEKQKVAGEFETHKKAAVELQKRLEKEIISKGEELGSCMRKMKAVETELATIKTESTKQLEEHRVQSASTVKQLEDKLASTTKHLEDKLASTSRQLEERSRELEKLRQGETQNREEIQPLKEQLATLQSQHNVMTGELEVVRASLERSVKTVQERDETCKKLKQRVDELQNVEASLKKANARIEKEREDTAAQIAPLAARIKDLEAKEEERVQQLQKAEEELDAKMKSLMEQKATMEAENEELVRKGRQAENDMKILERKSAQIVKDLQKQLAKERKQRELHEDADAQGPTADERSPSTKNSNMDLSGKVRTPEGVGAPKVERLTDDLINLAQHNEALNKRAKYQDEEIRQAQERIQRLAEELEQKSSVIRQYALRDHAQTLQPDEKPKTQVFNLNILSSNSAMQKMDPVTLAQINTKMQKLLEELTTKMMGMEERLKKFEGGVQGGVQGGLRV
ncbi:hypothetical protein PhCBS80983_g02262 [Powellomyces hirtus]|uniref:Uncharacterized protein n=1 Tax=Powellomyces hirtus TaxID=109895 RepID=A0A507E9G9_9FUNG|nr:hypothetical protein PhCBS80983_g02262 [Powellomyces hirtus]